VKRPDLERVGDLHPGFLLGIDDAVRADLGQDLAVGVGFRLGDDPGHANPLQDQRAAYARLDILTLAHHGDLGALDAERQERLLIRAVGLGGEGSEVGSLGDALLRDVDGGDVIAQVVADAGNAGSEPSEPDNGDPLARRLLAIPPKHAEPFPIALFDDLPGCGGRPPAPIYGIGVPANGNRSATRSGVHGV
jgi:hypothetical protein